MTPRTRLNLTLALTFLAIFCITSAMLYRSLMNAAMTQVRRESTLRMEMALAVRSYTTNDVRPLLQATGHPFDPPAIPAYAANRSMALLSHEHPQYRYREVALNPTNPANRAADWEAEAIDEFRRDPQLTELTRFTDGPHGAVMHVLHPVRPTAECMNCHGAEAPPALLQRYGPRGLGWKVGDTVGAQIVSVPAAQAIVQARTAWGWHVAATLTIFGALFIVLNRILDRAVLAPIEGRSSEWQALAHRDPLTGVANRRSFEEQGTAQISASEREGRPLALVAIDIDHFKRINDQHGHAAGDTALQAFVRRVQQALPPCHALYRLGGEEFALLLPGTDEAGAARVAETLRRALAQTRFEPVGALSASFGVAMLHAGDTLDALMQRADAALYGAKAAGRNRVVCSAQRQPA
jgi:diguanylate cyclase (GGDEF)-like protein